MKTSSTKSTARKVSDFSERIVYGVNMTIMRKAVSGLLAAGLLVAPFSALAADKKDAGKAKAYPLKTCIVSDEDLGSMGDPYVFTHEGQEIKLCCKSCQKDFKKNPSKFLKKLEKTDKKK